MVPSRIGPVEPRPRETRRALATAASLALNTLKPNSGELILIKSGKTVPRKVRN